MFCDYCDCNDCKYGSKYCSYAQTDEDKNICDICYHYDVCVNAQRLAGEYKEPCKDLNCKHRPKIISEWKKFDDIKEKEEA